MFRGQPRIQARRTIKQLTILLRLIVRLEWVSFWSVPQKILPALDFRVDIRRSRENSLLPHWKFSRKTTEGALHKSVTFSKLQHPAAIEGEQILLASNNSFAKFKTNNHRNSKLPQSLTTASPTNDGKFEKFELLKIFSNQVSRFLFSWQKTIKCIAFTF